ncbi:hypothetical protein B0T14DRAFT_519251 [Immersiella caudata]|uniref:Uncharacterized protein n=1 Tax=Immersiella caudata TaxID=314043 RepID=A0AA39WPW8_9PEZI|nr:hypothetical protein B0T14DRAFT_519251 [Immersiella caudata]
MIGAEDSRIKGLVRLHWHVSHHLLSNSLAFTSEQTSSSVPSFAGFRGYQHPQSVSGRCAEVARATGHPPFPTNGPLPSFASPTYQLALQPYNPPKWSRTWWRLGHGPPTLSMMLCSMTNNTSTMSGSG